MTGAETCRCRPAPFRPNLRDAMPAEADVRPACRAGTCPLEQPSVSTRDIEAAAGRLMGHAVRTPLLSCPDLDARCGGRILLKAEPLQRTGSFKFRGAFNRIAQLTPGATPGGVVAVSSGNHGQAVAASARHFGLPAAVLMPSDAPAIKVALTRREGAEVILYDRRSDDRLAMAERLVRSRDAVFVPPYDDPDVIAGQGTVGLEIIEDLGALGLSLDRLLCCCGGGGLVAGVATAVHAASPGTAIFAVEPAGFDDTARSLQAGIPQVNAPDAVSICDAIRTPTPGAITFPINRRLLAGGLTVTDDEVRTAVAYAARHLKLVVEPGGAVALAAVLAGRIDCSAGTTVAVLSGGNIDGALLSSILADAGSR